MWRIALIAALLPGLAGAGTLRRGAPSDAPPLKPIELYCTDGEGHRVELGEVICIQAGCDPEYLARCDMSLNNVMWRKVQDGCPGVLLTPAPQSVPARAAG